MTSEGLGEMFEGDSADTCAGKFPLTSMGAERRVSRGQTRERGPHRHEQKFLSSLHRESIFTDNQCEFEVSKAQSLGIF